MKKKLLYTFLILLAIALVMLFFVYLAGTNVAVMNPKGWVAQKQKDLIILSTILMLIVVVPVFILTVFVSWKFRGHHKHKYSPDWDSNHILETVWWCFPLVIVGILSVVAYKSCHLLDPYKPLESTAKPLRIQVVALQWKWLFIYPEEQIATVNFFQIPEQRPINLEITADAPMNSFWLPQLAGQIYAMAGMRSKLHLIAHETGSYKGSSANISGEGFSGMTFTAKVSTQEEFDQWVQSVKQSPNLGLEEYKQLAKPSSYNPVASYVLQAGNLFDWIMMSFMMPPETLTKSK